MKEKQIRLVNFLRMRIDPPLKLSNNMFNHRDRGSPPSLTTRQESPPRAGGIVEVDVFGFSRHTARVCLFLIFLDGFLFAIIGLGSTLPNSLASFAERASETFQSGEPRGILSDSLRPLLYDGSEQGLCGLLSPDCSVALSGMRRDLPIGEEHNPSRHNRRNYATLPCPH